MQRTLLSVLLICSIGITLAQSTFDKIYNGIPSAKFNLVEMPDGSLMVGLGQTRAISHLDIGGNVTYTHSYWAHPTEIISGFAAIRQYSQEVYLVVGGYKMTLDTCAQNAPAQAFYHPTIAKVDQSGNVMDHRHYALNDGCRNVLGDLIVTADGGIVAWGYENSFLIMKVGADLEPLWARRFPYEGGFQFIKELPSGDLLAGINLQSAGAVVARMNPNGEFLWCKSYIRPRGMVHDAVIESDDSFVITGFTDSTASTNPFIPYPPSFHPKLFMMSLNGQGSVQWCKGYDSAPDLWYTRSASHLVKSRDGN